MATIRGMRLADYLSIQGQNAGAFARQHGFPRYSVYRWISNSRRPNAQALRKIYEITGGSVTPNDFVLQQHREIPLTQECAG